MTDLAPRLLLTLRTRRVAVNGCAVTVARSHFYRGSGRADRPVRSGGEPDSRAIHVDSEAAIVDARRQGRLLALRLGFEPAQAATVVTVIAELARNILLYAGEGELTMLAIEDGRRHGLQVSASDQGPGIDCLSDALSDGFSTSGRLGLGLPGVKRLADEFEIVSAAGTGTTVTTRTWRR
jgi:serine/threonine-protein kinase RsbT